MLQALPEDRSADALVDARQALVRRVIAPAPVDVRSAPVWKQNLGRPTPSTRPHWLISTQRTRDRRRREQ